MIFHMSHLILIPSHSTLAATQTMASNRRFELLEAYANTTAEEAVESRARVQELQERFDP